MKPFELDLLIAEKVMGVSKLDLDGLGTTWSRTNDATLFYLKPYSTDMAAAWEVVEKLESIGYALNLGRHPTRGWLCVLTLFWPDRGHPGSPFAPGGISADTAPEAICLAALKALKVLE